MSKYIVEIDDNDKEICKQYINGKLSDELGDCVNVTELAEAIANGVSLSATINTNDIEYKAYCKGLEDGKKIARPQGEWIEENSETGALGIKYTWFRCNQCGWNSSLVIPKNFCPNCGADMRKGGAE